MANQDGLTPSHCALNRATLELLYDRGADILVEDESGKLPLHHAARDGRVDCVSFLCNMCPEFIDSTDRNGNSPLHEAAAQGSKDVLQILIDALGTQVAAPLLVLENNRSQSCMDLARENNHQDCIELISIGK